MRLKQLLTTGALSLLMAIWSYPTAANGVQEKLPAFPGAEGYGRYVTGGRGGKVYHVTNLNDSGTGSLRWALNQSGYKTIVFDVAGTIHLQSKLTIRDNTTVAGQTSPGGICIADYPVNVSGRNIIVRYMRFRLGNNYVTLDGADGWDGFGGMDSENLMIDHCSVSWSIDECCSFLGNKNTTVQWCLISQSLVNAGHSKGAHGYGGNWGGSGASFHHNLLAHHGSRTPRFGPRPTTQLDERMDYRNNVIYNFGGNGCYGGEAMKVNIVNNYYKPGPGSPTNYKGMRIAGIGIRTNSYVSTYPDYAPALHIWGKYYVEGNKNSKFSNVEKDNWTYGMYNQIDVSATDGTYTAATKDSIRINEPIPFVYTTTHTADDAYTLVLQYAGASNYRDAHDSLMVSDTHNGTASYTGSGNSAGFINSQEDIRPVDADADWSAWPALKQGKAMTDTDGDGMDDNWEDLNGLDPGDPTDGAKTASNGYTNLENYLNSLVNRITTAQNTGGNAEGNIEEQPSVETSEYELSASSCTSASGASLTWEFNNGLTISTSRGYATGTGCGITGIKYSRNAQFTVNLPEGISIYKADLNGYSNVDNETAYLSELGGNAYETTDYVFPSRTGGATATHSITLAQPVSNKLTFTFKGQQVVMNITLHAQKVSTGIKETKTIQLSPKTNIYSIDGRRVSADINSLSKGVYIIGGKKIVIN
jgi:hypothetical protein